METLIEATDDEIADGTDLKLGLDLNGGAATIGLTADFLLLLLDRILRLTMRRIEYLSC